MIKAPLLQDLSQESVWRELEAQLRPFIARRLRSEADVDDVVQNVFLNIHRGVALLRDDQSFGPWVYRIARSAIVDHQRSAARHPIASTNAADEADLSLNDEEVTNVEQEVAAWAALFVSLLPSPYREALTLTEIEGVSQKEAAEMLGLSVSGMKSRVQRGRRKLRAALEDCCHIALDARQRVLACEPRADGKLPTGCSE